MEAIKQLEALISAKISEIKTVYTLFRLETQLAGLSIFPLILTICMLFVVLSTAWLSVMILLGYFILLACEQYFLTIFLIFLFHIGFLIGLFKYLSFNLKNMSYQKTRAYFSQNKSTQYEQLEKEDKGTNYKHE